MGNACGFGIAVHQTLSNCKYTGTFYNDLPHGFCKSFLDLNHDLKANG